MSLFISEEYACSSTHGADVDQTYETGIDSRASKKADLAGPGIGDYDELATILPNDYQPASHL